LMPRLIQGAADHMFLYNAIAAVTVCGLACSWAGLKVLREIR
jgi:hypothetical protein